MEGAPRKPCWRQRWQQLITDTNGSRCGWSSGPRRWCRAKELFTCTLLFLGSFVLSSNAPLFGVLLSSYVCVWCVSLMLLARPKWSQWERIWTLMEVQNKNPSASRASTTMDSQQTSFSQHELKHGALKTTKRRTTVVREKGTYVCSEDVEGIC